MEPLFSDSDWEYASGTLNCHFSKPNFKVSKGCSLLLTKMPLNLLLLLGLTSNNNFHGKWWMHSTSKRIFWFTQNNICYWIFIFSAVVFIMAVKLQQVRMFLFQSRSVPMTHLTLKIVLLINRELHSLRIICIFGVCRYMLMSHCILIDCSEVWSSVNIDPFVEEFSLQPRCCAEVHSYQGCQHLI